MVRRHRDLRGPDEVHVLALDPVDVVGGLAEEAGALHRARLDHRRRDHLGEAVLAGGLVRQVDQRELELGADAGEEVEPRAGHLGAALDVDRAEDLAELDVVARLEVELDRGADLLDQLEVVLAARGRLVGGQGRDAQHRRLPLLLGGTLGGLGLLDLGGQGLGLGEQRLLLVALGLRDQLARASSAPRAWPRRPGSPYGGQRRRRARGPRPRRTARAWPGRRAHGRGRLGGSAGRSCRQGYRGPRRRRSRDTRPAYFPPCSTVHAPSSSPGQPSVSCCARCWPSASPRSGPGWSTSTTAASPRGPGRPTSAGCTTSLRFVEIAFGTIAMTIYTVVLCRAAVPPAPAGGVLHRRRDDRDLG